jgi:hypothetical protein
MRKRIWLVGIATAVCGFALVSEPAAQAKKPAAKTATTTVKKAAPAAATSKKTTKATATKSKAVAKKVQPPAGPPKGAVEVEPGTFRWVDPKGKSWIYSQSPFGWMKGEEQESFRATDPVPTDWTVTDQGDSLTFDRPYPFGGNKQWTVKKTDLTEMEAAVWKRSQAQAAEAASTAGK